MDLQIKWKEKSLNDKGAIVLVQNARLAACYLAKPQIWQNPPSADYNVQILIPKGGKEEKAFLAGVEKSLKAIAEKSKVLTSKKDKDSVLKAALKFGTTGSIIRDGDEITDGEGNPLEKFANAWVLKAKTKAQNEDGGPPMAQLKLVDRRGVAIEKHLLEDMFYPGVIADVQMQVKAYNSAGNKGITCYLSGVMKVKDGERLGGINVFETRDDIEDDDEYEETDEM